MLLSRERRASIRRRCWRGLNLALIVVAALLVSRGETSACCDVVPAPDDFSRAALGSITKPALVPGFSAQVFARPAICNQQARSAAADFRNPTSPMGCTNGPGSLCDPLVADDFAIHLVFTPQMAGAPHHVVVLRDDCDSPEFDASACSLPNGGSVFCIDRTPAAPGDPKARFSIVEVELPGGTDIERRLSFRYPDTSGLAGAEVLSGPVTVAVTRSDAPVPCGLATSSCTAFPNRTFVTCAQGLFRRDTTCLTGEASIDPVSLHVTALPKPNLFTNLCVDEDGSGLCQASGATAPEIRFAQDVRGNVLVPMDYRDVIGGQAFARTLRGGIALAGTPFTIKNDDHVESRALNWASVLPIFEPVADLDVVFGTIDAGYIVHRIFNSSCAEDPEIPCSVDAECGTTCSVENFDATLPCAAGGTGPIVGECPLDVATAKPVCKLGGIVDVATVAAAASDDRAVPSPVNECVAQVTTPPELLSRNDDSDLTDLVLTVRDRGFGFEIQKIGSSQTEGRVMSRILEPPFAFNSFASKGEVVAFLEPEFQDGGCLAAPMACDRNANNLVFDHLLAAYRLGDPGDPEAVSLMAAPQLPTDPVTPGVPVLSLGVAGAQGFALAVEPTRNVQNGPLAISDGLVFFRASRLANAPRSISLASSDTLLVPANAAATEVSVSPDGGFVAFTSAADNLVAGDGNEKPDVFLKNLATNETTRISLPNCDQQQSEEEEANGQSGGPAVSENGQWVAFWSFATNLVPGDSNNKADIFVRETGSCNLVRVSVDASGNAADDFSVHPSISADGRFVAFESRASNLDAATVDTNGATDIFVHDRNADGTGPFDEGGGISTTLVSVDLTGAVSGNAFSTRPALSADGSAVTFASGASNLVAGDGNGLLDVFAEDASGALALASVASDGFTQGNFASLKPSISASGRWIAFESDATTLVNGDTNVRRDVFVHDLETGLTRRAGVSRAPRQCRQDVAAAPLVEAVADPDGSSEDVRISGDGRFLVYKSGAANLVSNDASPGVDLYVEDLLTGAVALVSATPSGAPGGAASGPGAISSDGSVIAFQSAAGDLGPALDPGAPASNAFVHAPPAGNRDAALGVLDTRTDPPTLRVLDVPAEHMAVANGAALFVAPGENVKLFRFSCGGGVGDPLCDESCTLPCAPVVEDLLRPGVSARDAISITDGYACALVTGVAPNPNVPVPACHQIGTSPSSSLDPISTLEADSIQVKGSDVVFTSPEAGGRALYEANLAAPSTPQRVQKVQDVVLGSVVCFTSLESELGPGFPDCDQNTDGDCDDLIMFADDLADGEPAVSCQVEATPCVLPSCDPRVPFSVVPKRTCKFLSDEELRVEDCVAEGKDRNFDKKCTWLTRRCTPVGNVAIASTGDPFDPLAEENPVEAQAGGDTNPDLAGVCVPLNGTPTCNDSLGPCPCFDADEICSDKLVPPLLCPLTTLSPDSDGDGIPDRDDVCPNADITGSGDFDQDGVPDACDGFVCGDGILQIGELCDPAAPEGEFCHEVGSENECTPIVRMHVQNTINPQSSGNAQVRICGTPLLNLGTADVPHPQSALRSLPAQMIDVNTLLFRYSEPGMECPEEGATMRHDLNLLAFYQTHVVVDDPYCEGLVGQDLDVAALKVHFPIPDLGPPPPDNGEPEQMQTCLTGALSVPSGASPEPPEFEARDPETWCDYEYWPAAGFCGIGFELALLVPLLQRLRRSRVRR